MPSRPSTPSKPQPASPPTIAGPASTIAGPASTPAFSHDPAAGHASAHRLTPAPYLAPALGPTGTGNQTLWQKALDKIPASDKEGVDFQAGGLLHNLINLTKEKKVEIEAKRWVYQNSNGEPVFYVDTFLTLLNKYAHIVNIGIQHDPHVTALVWSGFRFLLQVIHRPPLS